MLSVLALSNTWTLLVSTWLLFAYRAPSFAFRGYATKPILANCAHMRLAASLVFEAP
jgi:hypothetical protein